MFVLFTSFSKKQSENPETAPRVSWVPEVDSVAGYTYNCTAV